MGAFSNVALDLKGARYCGVYWVGKICSWQVVRRYEIEVRRPQPGTGNELYVMFQIESWEKHPTPIKPGGYGVYSHLFATRYMFQRGDTNERMTA